MKKYTVIITVNFETGAFYIPVSAQNKEKAQEYGINKFLNENPIYKDCYSIYEILED